jgi:hydroxymethylpyrimidine/phosphomethylpyrimidine kinase
MKGLFVGNPAGYESNAFAIRVASSSFAVKPSSVLSDKIVVRSVVIEAPEVNLETDLKSINLKKLLNNVEESTGASGKETPKEATPTEAKKANKKLEVDEFVITGTKLHVGLTAPLIGRKTGTVTMPEIKLPPMGQSGDGVTVAEASSLALQALLKEAIAQGEKMAADMMKGGQYLGSSAGTNTNVR